VINRLTVATCTGIDSGRGHQRDRHRGGQQKRRKRVQKHGGRAHGGDQKINAGVADLRAPGDRCAADEDSPHHRLTCFETQRLAGLNHHIDGTTGCNRGVVDKNTSHGDADVDVAGRPDIAAPATGAEHERRRKRPECDPESTKAALLTGRVDMTLSGFFLLYQHNCLSTLVRVFNVQTGASDDPRDWRAVQPGPSARLGYVSNAHVEPTHS
jgi:hypothetical protein